MARAQVEPCMFCGNLPCTCIETKPKPKVKLPAATPPVATEPQPKKYVLRALPPPVESPTRTGLQQTDQVRDAADEEREFRRALTLLCTSGLVSVRSIEENRHMLDLSPQRVNILLWKQRRREWQQQRQQANT